MPAMLVVSCGGEPQVASETTIQDVDLGAHVQKAGTRLKPLAWVSDDGPTIYTRRFYDVERREDCAFSLADDGTYRCFPSAAVSDMLAARRFSDFECKEQVVADWSVIDGEFPPKLEPRYAAFDDEGGCGTGRTVYELLPMKETQVYARTLGQCVPAAEGNYYRRGARLANEAFVRGIDAVSRIREGQLGAHQYSAADGAAALIGLYDLQDRVPCAEQSLDDGGWHCVGTPTVGSHFLPNTAASDGTHCSTLVTKSTVCTTPRYAIEFRAVHRTTPVVAITQPALALWECMSIMQLGDWEQADVLMDAVPTEAFPPLIRANATQGRLIQYSRVTGPEGIVILPSFETSQQSQQISPPSFRYADTHLECKLLVASDGEVRCLPNPSSTTTYADANCSEPLIVASNGQSPDPAKTFGGNGEEHRTFAPGEPYLGEVYRINGLDGCQPLVTTDNSDAYYRLGVEIPPESFVRYRLKRMP